MNRRLLALGAGAILLAVPATADAAITVGPDPDAVVPSTPRQSCDDGAPTTCTLVQDERFFDVVRVPAPWGDSPHGVITSWRIYGGDGEARLRRFSPDATTALASGPWSSLPAGGGVAAHAVELPVVEGDAIGVDLSAGATIAAESFGLGSDTLLRWTPALPDGATRQGEALDGEIYLQFTVEPDRNQDGRGDESHPPPVDPPPPPPPPYEPPPHQPPPPNDPPSNDPPRTNPGRNGPADDTGRSDPYAGLPKAGPSVTIAGRASASRKGVASFSLANPYGFGVKGTVKVKRGRRAVGSAKVTLAANGTRTVKVRLDRAGKRAIARGRKVKLTLAATLRAPVGRARTTTKPVTVSSGRAIAPARPRGRSNPTPPQPRGGGGGQTPDDAGFDGTYRAPDGLTMVVQDGRVLSFSGTISTYCTRTSKQKNVAFGMFGDDPDPVVAPNGSFAYEATTNYGFIKLKYDGRIVGTTASGRLVVEDRSPLLGTGRFEFDYCFAGKDWSASK